MKVLISSPEVSRSLGTYIYGEGRLQQYEPKLSLAWYTPSRGKNNVSGVIFTTLLFRYHFTLQPLQDVPVMKVLSNFMAGGGAWISTCTVNESLYRMPVLV